MKKSKLAITVVVSAALLASACAPSTPDWNEDSERYCVDDDGDIQPMKACDNSVRNGHGNSGMFFLMYGSQYKSRYGSKYKANRGKMRSSSYLSKSSVIRGSGGSTARSYSGSVGS